MNEKTGQVLDGIAIIGMAGRFPGAPDVDAYWRNLRNGVESIRFFSDEELAKAGVARETIEDPHYVKANGVLDGIEDFDAGFFGISPREAEILDPQHRLFLECAWETLEHGGYDPYTYEKAIGVYAGVGFNAYLLRNLATRLDLIQSFGLFDVSLANDKDYVPTRVSYKLDLRGPSLQISTACSSSLVAVHVACQSLMQHECDMALAGGVTIGVPQNEGYLYRKGGTLSPDGHCRAFDADGAGMVGGNGIGLVLLKRAREAYAEGDHIHAIIRGTAINNDGREKVGYTAPSVDGQAEVIAEALALAEVDPRTISYVEAHGTGTSLGDPIELEALNKAYQAYTGDRHFCAIGSAKTNIGHLDRAAGVAGLIKTVLAMRHGEIPPTLNFSRPNPKINFENSPFVVNDTLRPWARDGGPRRAGVSSFGIGGTNAHAVIEEAPEPAPSDPGRRCQLLALSAKTPEALDEATRRLAASLKDDPDVHLADVAYTLAVGRQSMPLRRTLVCTDREDAVSALLNEGASRLRTSEGDYREREVCFMFTGQGAQYPGMTRGLYESEALFRQVIDQGCERLMDTLGFDLRGVLYPEAGETKVAEARLRHTAVTQPALFLVEMALARLWMSWGVKPKIMIGHSIGEYAAACVAGVMSFEDAVSLVAERGRLLQALPPGAMLAVAQTEAEALKSVNARVALAAVNAPDRCVLSGPEEEIQRLEETLPRQGHFARRLQTSHAFHSPMMEPCLERFAKHVQRVALKAPGIPYISNVTGKEITAAEATDPSYYARHLRGTVRFSRGLQHAMNTGALIFIEVGPGNTLATLARQHLQAGHEHGVVASVRHPKEDRQDDATLIDALAQVWLAAGRVDWAGFHAGQKRRRVPLPTYPFQRQRYWVDACPVEGLLEGSAGEGAAQASSDARSLERLEDVKDWFYTPAWTRRPLAHGAPRNGSEQWLLFVDENEESKALVRSIRMGEESAVCVHRGHGFERHGDDAFTIHPGNAMDCLELMTTLQKEGRLPDRVVHAWMTSAGEAPACSEAAFERAQILGCFSLLHLVKTLARVAGDRPVALHAVTRGCFDVTGHELLAPEWATHLGLWRVVPQEYPNLRCRTVDLPVSQEGEEGSMGLSSLLSEFRSEADASAVAYRSGQRWISGHAPRVLPEAAGMPVCLRRHGVYLVTGGLGNIGMLMAEYLAEAAGARLVLLGRSAFPDRETWDAWVSEHEVENVTSRKIQRIRDMEKRGAEVFVLSGDVSQRGQMTRIRERIEERFGPVQGVFHAAGLLDGSAFRAVSEMETALYERHFGPKARALFVLRELFGGEMLDFCMLFSSLSTVLGGLGYSAYAAGNSFMDAFAAAENRKGRTFWQSVDWDGWRFDEGEPSVAEPLIMKLAIRPREGRDCFARLLTHATEQHLVVSTGSLRERLERWRTAVSGVGETPDHSEEQRVGSRHQRPNLPTAYEAPGNAMEEEICAIWEELLGIERVGMHDNFFELGGHSLLGTQLLTRVRTELGMDLSLQAIFDHPTIAGMVEAMEQIAADRGGEGFAEAVAQERETVEV